MDKFEKNLFQMSKYVFCITLTKPIKDLIHEYSLEELFIKQDQEVSLENVTTKISSLNIHDHFSFYDENRKKHNCDVSMVDFQGSKIRKYNCFWCRNPFDTSPIGCPVNYKADKNTKSFDTYTTTYSISQEIPNKKGVYITDGCFCSFNCCLAFIHDNKHNSMYNMSEILLSKMYRDIMGELPDIIPAHNWRMLQEYGGSLTISEFRGKFNNIFKSFGTIRQSSIGMLYEESFKF